MKATETLKLIESFTKSSPHNSNSVNTYRTTLTQFYDFSHGDILSEKFVKPFLQSLLGGNSVGTVENKYYAIQGLWNYHNQNLRNGDSKLDIGLLKSIKREIFKTSTKVAKQDRPELPIAQIVYSVTPECLAPNFNSDIAILKAKLREVKLSTNEAIVTKQQQIIAHELNQCGYNTLTEWLIDRGDILISQLEQCVGVN